MRFFMNFNPGAALFALAVLHAAAGSAAEIRSQRFEKKLPEGNYDVTVRFGSPGRSTVNWVKAESRRLMLDKVSTAPGEFVTRTFTVNIRTPEISGGRYVSLKKREIAHPRWDDKLDIEIFSDNPEAGTPEIVPAEKSLTLYLAGDSTVTDQDKEPWTGWGQMLPAFFRRGVAVANHSEGGMALSSFAAQRRLEKILSRLRPGDYVFIQFGHNDQKEKGKDIGPFTSYRKRLAEFVRKIRAAGGNAVLITPMERRRFRDGRAAATLASFAEAVRQAGGELDAPVIDLNRMSMELYNALGEEGSKRAFVFYPAGSFPGQDKALRDNTHHNVYGGYELARCVAEAIRSQMPELAKHLRPELPPFDPARPDKDIGIPASVTHTAEKPDGN